VDNPSNPLFGKDKKEMIERAESQLKNMGDDELNSMMGMMKGMDNNTIKSMMAMQGMNYTDDQINMMKNNMNPDMFKMMKNMNGGANTNSNSNKVTPTNNTNNNNNNNLNTASRIDREDDLAGNEEGNGQTQTYKGNQNTQNNTPFGGMKNMPDLSNMDMGSMLKFIQSNPQMMNMMGPQFANMFPGGNNQTGGGGPGNQDAMMNAMQSIFWLMGLPARIKAFFTSTRGIILSLFILFLIISYFYR